MRNARPLISIVIPTYNRANSLRRTLRSLLNQTIAKDKYEVIVIDDGGSDDARVIVEEVQSVLNLKYYWQPDYGFRVARARNIGCAMSEGAYVMFVDCGVLLASDCVATHLSAHQSQSFPTTFIGYVFGFEQPTSEILAAWHPLTADADADDLIINLQQKSIFDIREAQYCELGDDLSRWPAPFDIVWGCHFSTNRELAFKVGLFDETFNSWGGEDVDFALRLFLGNSRFCLLRAARSIHLPEFEKSNLDKYEASRVAAARIHKKYNLWQTSFYGRQDNDKKYSLNSIILRQQDAFSV